MEEKKYRIEVIKENLEEDKKIIPFLSAGSIAYFGASALLLHLGIDKIANGSYVLGALASTFGVSFALSDLVSIRALKEVLEQHINEKEELNNLSR